jgi:hypothetical protein
MVKYLSSLKEKWTNVVVEKVVQEMVGQTWNKEKGMKTKKRKLNQPKAPAELIHPCLPSQSSRRKLMEMAGVKLSNSKVLELEYWLRGGWPWIRTCRLSMRSLEGWMQRPRVGEENGFWISINNWRIRRDGNFFKFDQTLQKTLFQYFTLSQLLPDLQKLRKEKAECEEAISQTKQKARVLERRVEEVAR